MSQEVKSFWSKAYRLKTSEQGESLCNEVAKFTTALFQKYCGELGYSPREVAHIINLEVLTSECEYILNSETVISESNKLCVNCGHKRSDHNSETEDAPCFWSYNCGCEDFIYKF